MDPKGWHSRGYLPHFDTLETLQFVTFRLADSLPKEALERISLSDRPESLRDDLLDHGWGASWLKRSDVAKLVEDALLKFDGARYRLCSWTIMPNHVHVLFEVLPSYSLGTIVSSWKRYTARQANLLLKRSGAFWQVDYWDRFIRDERHFHVTLDYIDQNPVKAGLVDLPHDWPWGSARLRV
jgi:putative transposase